GFSISKESQQAFDGPLQLHLPPIEGVFPEWGTGPLRDGHDRNIPPPPPAPPPLPPPPPPAPVSRWREFLRRYF
ncbi:MAG TPA: hypothetical protein VJP40_01180, partial [bacterium]|nr:hypothetical protein [bacterium]